MIILRKQTLNQILIFICLISGLLSLSSTKTFAQESKKRVLNATQIEPTTITIDGKLDEDIWQVGEAATHFIQQQPHVGAKALAESFIRIAYDDTHLYIGARLDDPSPDEIHADERQEDGRFNRSDAFAILIDSYHDHQNAFFFESNLLAATSDALVSQEGKSVNRDWDGRWTVAAARQTNGWAIEFKIPFETIRFQPGKTQTWGIQFRRRVPHLKEVSFWSPLSIEQGFFEISRAGHLENIKTTEQTQQVLSLKPYAKASYEEDQGDTTNGSKTDFDGGLDLHYQFQSNLSLDLSYNTDFSETEVDRFQANLTRFPLFLPEKREFFIEGKSFYDFGISRRAQAFFSRNIGVKNRKTVPILGGGKLSGKVGPYSIGTLLMQTESKDDAPAEQFGVLRLSRDIGLRSNIGAIFTERAVRGSSGSETLGFDTTFAPHPNLSTKAFWMRAANKDEQSGDAQFAEIDWQDPFWRIRLNHLRIGEDFDPALGFAPQSDLAETVGFIDLRPQPTSGPIREIGLKTEVTYQRDMQNNFLYQSNYNRFLAYFHSGEFLLVSIDPQREYLPDDFTIRKGIVIPAETYTYTQSNILLTSDSRRPLSGSVDILWGGFYGGTKTSLSLSATGAPKEGLKIGAGLDIDWVKLPQGEFRAQILNGDIAWSLSNQLTLRGLFQWDEEDKLLAANLRLSWQYRDQSWFYFIVNPTRRDGEDSLLIQTKATFRFDP